MPDITMCYGIGCQWKEKCKRFTSVPDEFRQAYFAESPCKMVDEVFTCDFFWGDQNDKIYQNLKDICK
jgi:hypothetical protein